MKRPTEDERLFNAEVRRWQLAGPRELERGYRATRAGGRWTVYLSTGDGRSGIGGGRSRVSALVDALRAVATYDERTATLLLDRAGHLTVWCGPSWECTRCSASGTLPGVTAGIERATAARCAGNGG